MRFVLGIGVAALALGAATASSAQAPVIVQTSEAALAQDAGEYARRYGVEPVEAVRRLHAQRNSVGITNRIADVLGERLAGIAIDHHPFRIVVLLTGDAPVPDDLVRADTGDMPVIFRTGAQATRAELVAAISAHQATMRAALTRPPGMGIDPRTGELVLLVAGSDIDRFGSEVLRERFAELTGVPIAIRTLDRPGIDMVEGGGRVVGTRDGRRYACTTGFVVTDGTRHGVVTAAHCPDELDYIEGGAAQPLAFAGQWGWGHQDVQLNLGSGPMPPLFFADTAKTQARAVTTVRPLASTRGGEWLCHRGERTGYSCAPVELLDFAPAGDLCGGPCLPSWVVVAGPTCKAGDSGGPVFSGTAAFGIVKGGSYRADGSCGFYFYMSTDFLPAGWSLARPPPADATQDNGMQGGG